MIDPQAKPAPCMKLMALVVVQGVIDAIGQETESPQAREHLLRHVRLIEAESEAGDLIGRRTGSPSACAGKYHRRN